MSAVSAVRRAGPQDMDELTALWAHYIRSQGANPALRNLPPDALARRRDRFARHIEGPDSAVFVLERDDGGLDGFLSCFVETNDPYFHPPVFGRLQTPFVRPEARGRGLLHRLLDAAYVWAREMELTEVRLYMSPADERQNRLAEELGFEAIATVRRRTIAWDYPPGGRREAP
ncbi:MAG: GNAT family N-acetyltransferase [Gemmatimonadota bacterium]|nr:GNAT family N-acetyltransferase [Gemmatimonadota bacterium]